MSHCKTLFTRSLCLQTDIPDFRQTEMEVCRRFSDFLGLHEKLVVKHLHQGRIIPPAPEKSVIGEIKKRICVILELVD